MDDGAGVRAPMDVMETSRKRSAEDPGHETDDADRGSVLHDPGSMADRQHTGSHAMQGRWELTLLLAEAFVLASKVPAKNWCVCF